MVNSGKMWLIVINIVTTPSLLTSTVHVSIGDKDEWTTFDDHGRPVKKWTPSQPSTGCYMVMYTRTDVLHDHGCAFKSPESKEVIVRIINKCDYTNSGLLRGGVVSTGHKRKYTRNLHAGTSPEESSSVTKRDLACAVASIKLELDKLQNKFDQCQK